MDRRSFLLTASIGITTGIAGCQGYENSQRSPETSTTPTDGETDTPTTKYSDNKVSDTSETPTETDINIAGQWTLPRGDPGYTNTNPTASGLKPEPEEVLSISFPSGMGIAPPITVNNRIYVPTEQRVTAVDVSTGTKLWSKSVINSDDENFAGMLGFANNKIYVSTSIGVLAINGDTGEVVWQKEIEAGGPLIVFDDVLYVSGRFGIRALDAEEGTTLWTNNTPHTQIAADEETIYAAGRDRNNALTAIDARRGTEQWSWTPDEDFSRNATAWGLIAIDNLLVSEYWVAERGWFGVFSSDGGPPLWRRTFADYGVDSAGYHPAAVDGAIYINLDQETRRININNGETQWRFSTGSRSRIVCTSDSVFVGANQTIYNLAQTDGIPRWTYDIDESIQAAIPVGEYIVILSKEGSLKLLTAQ